MLTEQIQFPISLILTHRRGVGIIVCKNQMELIFLLSNEFSFFEKIKHHFRTILTESNMEYFFLNQILFSRVIGKTAENLFSVYQNSLNKVSLLPQEIKTLIVGVGPGSFTGLRLGSAFVNGLKIGSKNLKLLPVSTFLTPELLNMCKIKNCDNECILQLGEYEIEDESTGFVTFFDLYFCLKNSLNHKRSFVEFLSPEYGKEPGPVLKLREGNS